jgi:hypothetical protein
MKNCKKWYKNIEKHINLLEKTCKKTWKKLGTVKGLRVDLE